MREVKKGSSKVEQNRKQTMMQRKVTVERGSCKAGHERRRRRWKDTTTGNVAKWERRNSKIEETILGVRDL